MVSGQTTETRVLPTSTDTTAGENGGETLSLAAKIYFFRVMRMRFKTLYIHVVQKNMATILVLQAVHMIKTKNTSFSPQRNMMMLWKLDLKCRLLWPQQQKSLGRNH